MHGISSPSSCCLGKAPASTKGTLKKKGGETENIHLSPNTRQLDQNPPTATWAADLAYLSQVDLTIPISPEVGRRLGLD